MQQRSQRYVRRQRGWLGQSPASAESRSEADAGLIADEAALRGRRRRRPHFDERMAATKALVGYTPEDESKVAATGPLLVPHISAIAAEVYRGLLARPETASQFCDASGVIGRRRLRSGSSPRSEIRSMHRRQSTWQPWDTRTCARINREDGSKPGTCSRPSRACRCSSWRFSPITCLIARSWVRVCVPGAGS